MLQVKLNYKDDDTTHCVTKNLALMYMRLKKHSESCYDVTLYPLSTVISLKRGAIFSFMDLSMPLACFITSQTNLYCKVSIDCRYRVLYILYECKLNLFCQKYLILYLSTLTTIPCIRQVSASVFAIT